MEPIEILPETLGSIEVPLYFGVTQVATAGLCLLRTVAPRSDFPRFPTGPHAEFGKLVHRLMDLAASGRLGQNGVPSTALDAFGYLLAQTARRLSSSEDTRRYSDLSVAFTKRDWAKRRFLAIADAEELMKKRHTLPHPKSQVPRAEPLSLAHVLERNLPRATEVPFESAKLRIRGQLDLIESNAANEVTISDFKTGNVLDSDGFVNEHTSLQIRLYGLALLALAPEKRVSLRVVSRIGESAVSFGEDEQQTTSEWLKTKTDALPAGTRVEAEQIATPGSGCRGCQIRPICPAYRRAVRELWKRNDNPGELPLDIAGRVLSNESKEGYLAVKMLDLADRIVKVHRLSPRAIFDDAMSLANPLWFFDLASIEAKMQRTGWRQPRNFHEVAENQTERTAWTLRVFLDDPQGRERRM